VLTLVAGLTAATATLWLVRRLLSREQDRVVRSLIVVGLLVKLAGSMLRYTVMADLYGDDVGDFRRYFENGKAIAGQLRGGGWPEEASTTGTEFMDFITGVIYVPLPPNIILGFLVFAVLSFIGAYLTLRAFQIAVPDGDHRRFALGVFLLPTMFFWPSSIGKEAWLVFALGTAAYGAARVLRRERFGYLVLLLGTAAAFQVRPHMGALFAICFAGAFLLRFRDPDVRGGTVGWILGLVVVGFGAGYAMSNFGDELPQDRSIEGSTTDQIFAETDRRTSQGGSAYESRPVRNPADFVHAAITVPFRPFPIEAHNSQALITSFEGVALLGLVLLSIRRLAAVPWTMLRRPFVALSAAYTVGFIIAFSNVGNFGILTRQRAQLLPFLLVLLCVPPRRTGPDDVAEGVLAAVGRPGRAPVLIQLPPQVDPSSSA
jgi:hypothetical protein